MGRGRPVKSAGEHYAKGNYRAAKHGPLPAAPDAVDDLAWLLSEVKRTKAVLRKMKPGESGYTQLAKALDTWMERIAKIQIRGAGAGPPKPAVVSRPKTKLDKAGPPKR